MGSEQTVPYLKLYVTITMTSLMKNHPVHSEIMMMVKYITISFTFWGQKSHTSDGT